MIGFVFHPSAGCGGTAGSVAQPHEMSACRGILEGHSGHSGLLAGTDEVRPYSYRDDPAVPEFDDRQPIALMDGSCALCCLGARIIDRVDHSGEVRICPLQTPLGSALMRHYGLRVEDPDSWLLLENGIVLGELDAVMRLGRRSGGWGHLLRLPGVLPSRFRDALYRWVARNRYRWFGRADLCALPGARLRARLIGVVDA
jgi:predicted DCC family thiol-disulfide oxidoreductase YuxK